MELVYEGEQEGAINVAKHIIGKAIRKISLNYFPDPQKQKQREEGENEYREILDWFASGNELDLPDDLSAKKYRKSLESVAGLKGFIGKFADDESKQEKLVMMDVVLETLHQNSMLGKEDLDDRRSYSDMLGSMLGSMDDFDDFEDFEG